MATGEAQAQSIGGERVFVVAEIANAHEGSPQEARHLIDAAAEAGADAAKFQLIVADDLATPAYPHYALYQRLELPETEWKTLVEHAHGRGIQAFADAFGVASARLAIDCGFDGVKVPSADVDNGPLLELLAAHGRPILLATGGCTWLEIAAAVTRLQSAGAPTVVLMHGFQRYPTQLTDSHLRRLRTLRQKFSLPVGFAGHLDGASRTARLLPVWAAAAGAAVVEVHVTLDRSRRGLDYFSSLEPAEFAEMIRGIRELEPALGAPGLELGEEERGYRAAHKKWLTVTRDLAPGERIAAGDVALKRVPEPPPGRPLTPEAVIGRPAVRALTAHSPIRRSDIEMRTVATLACRAESSRLYGKPLQPVGDRPILQHLLDRLRQVERLDAIVLAISDGPSKGAFVDLAEQERLAWVVGAERDVLGRLIQAAEHARADLVLRTTTENPYIYWENLDELIRLHRENEADLTVTAELPLGALVEVISLDALKKSHQHGEDRHRSEFCTLFIAENPDVFAIQKVTAPEPVRRPAYRLTVDTPQDLLLVRRLWHDLHREGRLISIEEICRHLDDHPELASSNAGEQTLYLWK